VDAIRGRDSLKAHASAHGLFVGAAVNIQVLRSEPECARTLADQYNMVVAENAMKWEALRPAPDSFSFDEADELVAFAKRHKMKIRGHNFVWHQALPGWFASTVTKENARKFLTDHIMTVGGRYKGKIHSWDVVNEAILPKDGYPDGLRKSVWLELLGPDYIAIAFRAARQADPQALLTYNEYGVEYDNEEDDQRRAMILQLIRRLKAADVPLDAVGIQSHIKAGSPYAIGRGVREFMASAREMGLEVYLTELDVNEDDLPYDDAAQRDRAIAGVYRDYLTTILAEPAVKAVLTWGISDRHTWLNDGPTHKKKQPNRPQRSLPFDDNYLPTDAFFAMRGSFDQRMVSISSQPTPASPQK
jgi:endo-1,4-beta-xylanase